MLFWFAGRLIDSVIRFFFIYFQGSEFSDLRLGVMKTQTLENLSPKMLNFMVTQCS